MQQHTVALVSLFVSAIALIVASVVGWFSFQVNTKLLKILDRRAELGLRLTVEREKSLVLAPSRITFHVLNEGRRTAHDFYWHLYIPDAVWMPGTLADDKLKWEVEQIRGVLHRHYFGFHSEPVYPGRTVPITYLFTGFVGELKVSWQFTCEDGIFPDAPTQERGVMAIEVEPILSEPSGEDS